MERLDFEDFHYSSIEATIHLARYLNAKPYIRGKRVLDAACGEGYGSRLMLDWGAANVTGVDISETAIEKAKRLFGNKQVKYMVHDVEELPFPDNFFDVIVSLETVEHLTNPEKFLKELHRVLKKNGTAIISCPNDNYYAQNIPDYTNIYHKKRYSWPEYKQLVEAEFGEPTQWYMGNSLSGYINLPLMYCNDPENAEKAPANMQSIMESRRSSEIEIVPQDQYINHWVSVYYVAIWTQMEIDGCGESAAIYPVPTFFLHNDKKVPQVDPYDMVKKLEGQKQTLHDSYKEAMESLVLSRKTCADLTAENTRLQAELVNIKELKQQIAEANTVHDQLVAENDRLLNECAIIQIQQDRIVELEQAQSILMTDKTELENQCTHLKEIQDKIAFVIPERDTMAAQINELTELNSAAKQKNVELLEEITVLKNECSQLRNTVLDYEKQIVNYSGLQAEYDALKLQHNSALENMLRFDELQKETESHKKALQYQTEYSECLEEENRVLSNERDRLKAMNSMLTEEQTMLSTQIGHASWQVEQYTKMQEENQRSIDWERSEKERLASLLTECEDEKAALQERMRVLENERDRLKGMNSMLSEENDLIGSRADQLLYYCGTVEENVHLLETSAEYRFGMRCRPFLKVFKKPLLLILKVLRKLKNGFRKIIK